MKKIIIIVFQQSDIIFIFTKMLKINYYILYCIYYIALIIVDELNDLIQLFLNF